MKNGDNIKSKKGEISNGVKRILVIEDNADSREIFRTVLEREKFEVLEAVDGEDALSKIEIGEFSVILVDLSLPKISGWNLIGRIKKKTSLDTAGCGDRPCDDR